MNNLISKIITVSLICNVFTFSNAQNIFCDHEISNDQQLFDGISNNVLPGDTICVLAGNRNYLELRNIQGSEGSPVTVINKGGVVLINSDWSYGIKLNDCSHTKFTGCGFDQIPYGFIIQEVTIGSGISVDNKSTDIEIEKTEIGNVAIGGIYAKTEPDYTGDCTFPAVRDSFTMYNTVIHDCYLHDIGNEGMYIGSSKYMGQSIYHCNDTVVLPHVLVGVKVYDNILENTAWDAIQVSSAVSDCEIHDNIIINDSYAEYPHQMSGILIGGGSECDCYNNKIINGKGDGIDLLGLGGNKIYNNLIVNPGKDYHPNDPPMDYQKHGIWVGDIFTEPSKNFYFFNNTIISPRTSGIKLSNASITNNYVQNNIIMDPGAYQEIGEDAYICIGHPSVHLIVDHNYLNTDTSLAQFVDPLNLIYDLKAKSPAVNTGIDLSGSGITFDLENRIRPFDKKFDIGAYECQDSSLLSIPINQTNTNDIIIKCFPNPFNKYLNINYILKEDYYVVVSLLNTFGKEIVTLLDNNELQGKHRHRFILDKLQTGVYILKVQTSDFNITKKVVKFNTNK